MEVQFFASPQPPERLDCTPCGQYPPANSARCFPRKGLCGRVRVTTSNTVWDAKNKCDRIAAAVVSDHQRGPGLFEYATGDGPPHSTQRGRGCSRRFPLHFQTGDAFSPLTKIHASNIRPATLWLSKAVFAITPQHRPSSFLAHQERNLAASRLRVDHGSNQILQSQLEPRLWHGQRSHTCPRKAQLDVSHCRNRSQIVNHALAEPDPARRAMPLVPAPRHRDTPASTESCR